MAWGSGDEIRELNECYQRAVNLLLEVASGTKNQSDVREWLLENEPEKCLVKQSPKPIWATED